MLKTILHICVAVLLFSTSSKSQPREQSEASLQAGSAIQIHLLDGFALSYLIQDSNQSAVALTVDASMDSHSLSGPIQTHLNWGSITEEFTGAHEVDIHAYGIGGTISWIRFFSVTGDLALYLGTGATVRYSGSYARAYALTRDPAYRDRESTRTSEWAAGFRGIVGFQFMLTSSTGLLADYRPSVLKTWTRIRIKEEQFFGPIDQNTSVKGWSFHLRSISFGLTFRL
ncbi:MAG: hypothetical protein WEB37_07115 [Bacteroidota bacterium]